MVERQDPVGEEPPIDRLAAALARRRVGLFITFEGGDGMGKTTQISRLAAALADRGLGEDLVVTFEPGATNLGADLRRMIQHGPEDVDPRTEALLYAADRAYHVATVVKPALAAGKVVLQDRYIDSSVAYQGAARALGPEDIRELSMWGTEGLVPHVTVLLNMETETGLSRVGGEPDRLERAGLSFHRQVRQGFQEIAAQDPARFVMVDASGTEDEVAQELTNALAETIEKSMPRERLSDAVVESP